MANKIREQLEQQEIILSILYYGQCAMFHKGVYIDAKILEMIRMVDAMKDKKEYARSIFECNIKQIDLYARNHFFEGTTISIMKCVAKFNHHGVRNK